MFLDFHIDFSRPTDPEVPDPIISLSTKPLIDSSFIIGKINSSIDKMSMGAQA